MPGKQKRSDVPAPPPKCSTCNLACRFNLLRCDNCFRGVHLTCAKVSKQDAGQLGVYVCGSCNTRGVTDADVAIARNDKPCAVVFVSTCLHHNENKRRWKRSVRPPAEFPAETIDIKKECDKCNHKCVTAAEILCDRCDIGHHYLCADMTQALADTIDKWYCERCKTEDPRLQVTFKPLAEPTPAKHKDLIAAKRRTLVKRTADVDADEPGPSKRTCRGSIACKLVESKATDPEAAQPTSEPAVADGPTQLSDTLSATSTVGESAAFSRDENRQPRDAAVKLCQRETLNQSLRKSDPQRKCQTVSDASAENHRVVVENLMAQLAAQNLRLDAAAKQEQDLRVELVSLKRRIDELESAQTNERNDGAQQALASEGNAVKCDEPGTSHSSVGVRDPETKSASEPDEHLRLKLLNVVGEENPDVRHVPENASRELTDWMNSLESVERAELMKWTFGSPFGIFNDQKVLATGGQGAVHLVELKRAFAVKKAQLRLDDPRTLEFLIQEGKYAYNLFHKNLLSVLYRYIDGYNAYLVYPLMDAGDVSAIMGRLDRCLTEAEAAFVVREVLDALVYLHSHNVAHRDIKPQNVLANLKGEIMVADLGLCGDTTKPRVTGVGTPEFLPPELATARQRGPRGFKHDAKVDAWSLGVTLFELCTEHFPIQAQNLNTQYAQIRKSDFMQKCRQVVETANMELSVECWAFLARCFVHDPQGRATAQELRQSDFVKKAKPEDWTKAVRQLTEV